MLSKQSTAWEIKELGQATPLMRCPNGFNGNYLICNDGANDFRMNSHMLRFEKAYLIGYYPDYGAIPKMPGFPAMEEGGDTPVIEIGRCSPL
ncbi:hypothetical protein OKW33_000813 [Paraburkholderia atlantica]|uniref:hypothetical protein n=1 Tax=Paraburkholderia atlantica TaxID=2654982 RepID=UPI003D1E3FF2